MSHACTHSHLSRCHPLLLPGLAAPPPTHTHNKQGPRCSLRSKKMYSDAYPDYLRMTALNVPAALLVLGFLFSIDDITGVCLAHRLCV